ncbi:MAG: Hsp20/alpha crystallin family protein [Candidatus Pacebacteria bacterium]|nr:Hsp20/alpha crystallin family protein [Candidatus Paceibacterota bacterium]
MSLIPWRPFDDFDRFFSDEDWFLPVLPKFQQGPVMDVYETDKDVIAEVNLPGVDPEKIDVSVKNGALRISGASEEKTEEKKKGYWRKEIRKGSFERAVRLPAEVKEDGIDATYEKGVLKIVMPKIKTEASEKKVKIKVKD